MTYAKFGDCLHHFITMKIPLIQIVVRGFHENSMTILEIPWSKQAYLEPCQTSRKECFAKIGNGNFGIVDKNVKQQ